MTDETDKSNVSAAKRGSTLLRLAVPSMRDSTGPSREDANEKLNESHFKALFADDLRTAPMLSRLRCAVSAPSKSVRQVARG